MSLIKVFHLPKTRNMYKLANLCTISTVKVLALFWQCIDTSFNIDFEFGSIFKKHDILFIRDFFGSKIWILTSSLVFKRQVRIICQSSIEIIWHPCSIYTIRCYNCSIVIVNLNIWAWHKKSVLTLYFLKKKVNELPYCRSFKTEKLPHLGECHQKCIDSDILLW